MSTIEATVLKTVNEAVKLFREGPAYQLTIRRLNESDVDYQNWSDLELLIYYMTEVED